MSQAVSVTDRTGMRRARVVELRSKRYMGVHIDLRRWGPRDDDRLAVARELYTEVAAHVDAQSLAAALVPGGAS